MLECQFVKQTSKVMLKIRPKPKTSVRGKEIINQSVNMDPVLSVLTLE